MHAELCAQPGRSIAWHSWALHCMAMEQLAADVATIQHIAHAWDATSNGVALATRGRKCAGNATDHDMNSTIVASFLAIGAWLSKLREHIYICIAWASVFKTVTRGRALLLRERCLKNTPSQCYRACISECCLKGAPS